MAKLTLDAIRGVVKEEVAASEKRLEAKIVETKRDLNEKITTFKQEILGEIEKLRTDNEVLSSHGDRLEDHDQRIESLEKPTPIPA